MEYFLFYIIMNEEIVCDGMKMKNKYVHTYVFMYKCIIIRKRCYANFELSFEHIWIGVTSLRHQYENWINVNNGKTLFFSLTFLSFCSVVKMNSYMLDMNWFGWRMAHGFSLILNFIWINRYFLNEFSFHWINIDFIFRMYILFS